MVKTRELVMDTWECIVTQMDSEDSSKGRKTSKGHGVPISSQEYPEEVLGAPQCGFS